MLSGPANSNRRCHNVRMESCRCQVKPLSRGSCAQTATYRGISVGRENSRVTGVANAPFKTDRQQTNSGAVSKADQRPDVQARQVLLEMNIRERQDAVPRNRGDVYGEVCGTQMKGAAKRRRRRWKSGSVKYGCPSMEAQPSRLTPREFHKKTFHISPDCME